MFVGHVIVADQMDVEIGRRVGLYVPQEQQEPLMAMLPLALREHRGVGDIEVGEQCARNRG
jgi:hypothetical protein